MPARPIWTVERRWRCLIRRMYLCFCKPNQLSREPRRGFFIVIIRLLGRQPRRFHCYRLLVLLFSPITPYTPGSAIQNSRDTRLSTATGGKLKGAPSLSVEPQMIDKGQQRDLKTPHSTLVATRTTTSTKVNDDSKLTLAPRQPPLGDASKHGAKDWRSSRCC